MKQEEEKVKKKVLSLLLAGCMIAATLAGCGSGAADTAAPSTDAPAAAQSEGTEAAEAAEPAAVDEANLTETQKIIKEAEGMTLEELAQKAIEESNGQTFYGVGNSSRGKTALPLVIE